MKREEVECPECKGTGESWCPLEYGSDKHPDDCPACGGENKVICPECGGSGKILEY